MTVLRVFFFCALSGCMAFGAAGRTIQGLIAAVEANQDDSLSEINISYPINEAIFPPEFPAPVFEWLEDHSQADQWIFEIKGKDGEAFYDISCGDAPHLTRDADPRTASMETEAYFSETNRFTALRWRPAPALWAAIKTQADRAFTVSVYGMNKDSEKIVSRGGLQLCISTDSVNAPIFYRDVPLPFQHTLENLQSLRWRLGDISKSSAPPVLLEEMKVCGNCHSFDSNGRTIGMDVDYGSDKGSYVIADIAPETVFSKDRVISWSDYRRGEGLLTFGLLSQISPDGRYVLSTVKDRSIFAPVDNLHYSQRFFPVQGILVYYDRETKEFAPLNGAVDPEYVQSNASWSPDGKTVLFTRAKAHPLQALSDPSNPLVKLEEVKEFFGGGEKLRYDIYSVPFNEGRGGVAKPVPGASENDKSNYFPRYSPDGRWVVFCQADTFMLLQPDSELYIMPADASAPPRRMKCNLTGKMNSWHSWSPNGRWMVFSSKARGPFTQLWLAHVDETGQDAPPILLEQFVAADRAANIPEFVNVQPEQFARIQQNFADYYVHYRAGVMDQLYSKYEQAVGEFQLALSENPDHPESLFRLASGLSRLHRHAEALPYAVKLEKMFPGNSKVSGLLGSLYAGVGNYAEALRFLETAHMGNLDDGAVAANLAWILAASPLAEQRDGSRAVELMLPVCRVTKYRVPAFLDTLAAAYAEAGDFDAAVATTQQALIIVRGNPVLSATDLEQRLALYRAGKAYHEPLSP